MHGAQDVHRRRTASAFLDRSGQHGRACQDQRFARGAVAQLAQGTRRHGSGRNWLVG